MHQTDRLNPFDGLTDCKAVWHTLLQRAQSLIGPSALIAGAYEPPTGRLTVEAALGLGSIMDEFLMLSGHQVLGWSAVVPDKAKPFLLSGRLHIVPGGLQDLVFGQLPRGLARWLEELWNVPTIYSIGLVHNGELFGVLDFALREGGGLDRAEELSTLAGQCAAALAALRAGNRNGMEPAVGLEPTTT